jgi:putative phosphoribosyl transferase
MTSPSDVPILAEGVTLEGTLSIPGHARGVVLFAHGSGSSRFSPRNRAVAGVLHDHGFATLLLDLLTPAEERVDAHTAHLRFDVVMLARRLVAAVDWLTDAPDTTHLPLGCFGASTGAASALIAAVERPEVVTAVVSRGGRPDLAGPSLALVRAPTLLLVGGNDTPVIELNRRAIGQMRTEVRLEIVPGATHLFEEPGTLDVVAARAAAWFARFTRRAETAA